MNKLGLLHLTDIHHSTTTSFDEKMPSLLKVCQNDFSDCHHIFIILSGDIADSGKKEEYELFKQHLVSIFECLNKLSENVKILMVPGNHDCDFCTNNQARNNLINDISYQTIGDDNSVINACVDIQKNFMDFSDYFSTYYNESRMFCFHEIDINDIRVTFTGLNTAWMSSIEERTGSLFFPISRYKNILREKSGDLNIVFYHHPFSWLTPNSIPNNKNECIEFFNDISQVHLIGHEHENFCLSTDNLRGNKSLYLYGKVFNNDGDIESGFCTIKIDTSDSTLSWTHYNWQDRLYLSKEKRQLPLNNTCVGDFRIKAAFEDEITTTVAPLPVEDADIRDIYVYPDLEKFDINTKKVPRNISPMDLILSHNGTRYLLEGEDQIGRTTLLNMMFLDIYRNGKVALLVSGKDLSTNIERLLKSKMREEYDCDDTTFDKFIQMDSQHKILLVDDFHENKLNAKSTHEILKSLERNFSKIILCSNSAPNYSLIGAPNFPIYTIKPLGYKKTNELICNYYRIKGRKNNVDEQEFLQHIRETFDQVHHILGNKIIPSCPIFILSIVASLENTSFDLNQTSYGYCYQHLIYRALTFKAKVKNDEIDSFMNFLKMLSFNFYHGETDFISESDLYDFYLKYSKKYKICPYDKLKNKLLQSLLVKHEDQEYRFGYKYVFYFLVAKYIAEKVHLAEGKQLVDNLFSKIYHEDNANILVFIAHHSDDISFLDEAQLASISPFEKTSPLTLNKGAGYYSQILELANRVSNKIIQKQEDPLSAREKSLEAHDNMCVELQNVPKEVNELTVPFLESFRSIDIVGQIIKNRRGSLELAKIEELIQELFYTAFRTIGYLGDMFSKTEEAFCESLQEVVDDEEKIRKKINYQFQHMALQSCLNVFTRLIYAVGLKDFQDIFNSVAKKIDSPAAKIVSFSINSYYNKISISDLKRLVSELHDNDVALMILRMRVRSYIYYNYLDYREKQQIASILNMQISPQEGTVRY